MEKAVSFFDYEFEALVERHAVGKYDYTVVFLDPKIEQQLSIAKGSRLRMRGEVNDHPIEAAWQSAKGRFYAMLSKPLVKEAALEIGSFANVRFSLVDETIVDIPADILQLAANNRQFGLNWENLSHGKKRGFTHWINEAKTVQTRTKRIGILVDGLIEHPSIGPMELVRLARKKLD